MCTQEISLQISLLSRAHMYAQYKIHITHQTTYGFSLASQHLLGLPKWVVVPAIIMYAKCRLSYVASVDLGPFAFWLD